MVVLRVMIFYLLAVSSITSSAAENYDAKSIKQYLKNLKSVSIAFEQISDNQISTGIVLIKKPHHFRCNYFSGSPLLITGNSKFISIYDYDLDELSHIDKNDNILSLLVFTDKDIDALNIVEIIERQENVEFICFDDNHNQSTIIVNKAPFKLIQINFTSLEGKKVEVKFNEINQIKHFDSSLFSIKNPKVFGPPSKLSIKEIAKMIR